MKISNKVLVFILLMLSFAFYYLGKSCNNKTKTTIIQNTAIIKEIAELGSLSVSGTATIKESNKEDNTGMYAELKNIFIEKTLNLSIPFEAKYGVEMKNQAIHIDSKAKQVTVFLPPVQLLSFQLLLNNLEAIGKTGWLNSLSLDDLVKVEKILYNTQLNSLQKNDANKKLAEEHIRHLIQKYYEPMGLKVTCVFSEKKVPVAQQ
ncbi:MAG: DUF4230 domain-containing protein [Chitinophagaceae bacterium]|jgi:hypothetical protein|nr:DUF4230 domain-containing protein [Chitinophagaceae bacterium]MBP6988155.1 DUF4230 domain-containing protein [Ferruginibacter sp.]MBK8930651.1 DUF4230 domain-containing protein [Chitinophagaceae bacterium]MBP7716805.1 DUF4230 domain-containing protein [Ferruginibacter sp.]MBP8610785.1 DUF4230 domain-containing protein [Ferruginibacter sp.]